MKRNLSAFTSDGDQRHKFILIAWWVIQNTIFKSFLLSSATRVHLLRLFGADLGSGIIIRRGVSVHFPWNLKIGDNCWIGEEAWFINHELIQIGSNVCISQSAVICSSGHDFRSESLAYKHSAIAVDDGAWVCLRATVLAGSRIGRNSVVSAGEVFVGELLENHLYKSGICIEIKN